MNPTEIVAAAAAIAFIFGLYRDYWQKRDGIDMKNPKRSRPVARYDCIQARNTKPESVTMIGPDTARIVTVTPGGEKITVVRHKSELVADAFNALAGHGPPIVTDAELLRERVFISPEKFEPKAETVVEPPKPELSQEEKELLNTDCIFICPDCKKQCASRAGLVAHLRLAHPKVKKEAKNAKQ